MFTRTIQTHIEKWLWKNKIIILYGARQVGKTTLTQQIQKKNYHKKTEYYNCEDLSIQNTLLTQNSQQYKSLFKNVDLLILDEAQSIRNIGRILKLIHENLPNLQIIATGSSSFDLANQINEPLTGRSLEFIIHPISIEEQLQNTSALNIQSNLQETLTYGQYPEIINQTDLNSKERLLSDLTNKYLFKDILSFEGIKNSQLIYKILQAIAYQLGSQVNYSEIAQLVGSNKNTVEKYIEILEKSFIIFRLNAFSNNKRGEIKKMKKIYFHDTGIRNALIQDFRSLDIKPDKGALWENFIITEIQKKYHNSDRYPKFYFWRNYQNEEIDLIIEKNQKLQTYEIKWNPKKQQKIPNSFKKNYPTSSYEIINTQNFLESLENIK